MYAVTVAVAVTVTTTAAAVTAVVTGVEVSFYKLDRIRKNRNKRHRMRVRLVRRNNKRTCDGGFYDDDYSAIRGIESATVTTATATTAGSE